MFSTSSLPLFSCDKCLTAMKMGHRQRKKRVKAVFCLSKKRTDISNSLISFPPVVGNGEILRNHHPKIKYFCPFALECVKAAINPIQILSFDLLVRSGLRMDSDKCATVPAWSHSSLIGNQKKPG